MADTGAAKLVSRRELSFLLYEWLDVGALTERARFAEHRRESFDAFLDTAERVATACFLPHHRKADRDEPRFEDGRVRLIPEIGAAVGAFREAGFLSATQDARLGGLQLPYAVERACMAYFLAANVATAGYPFLTIANASLLVAHASPDLVERFARPQLEGRFLGTMCLSEPQAGSSLADIRTRAELSDDGTYRVFGTKMWISAGEHELSETIVHLVLARIQGAPVGTRGLSLFVVPKHLVDETGEVGERNDVVCAGLNHKMGCRAVTNCALSFGEGAYRPGGRAGAVGHLVGAPCEGLAQMFHMMNEARIGVGLAAAMLGMTAYLHSLDYARGRTQGRPAGTRDLGAGPVPIVEHPDVRRMLLAMKVYSEGALALCLYCARLVDDAKTAETDDGRRRASLLLDLLTPVAKSWPSQWCLVANDLAIQVHGGYGYSRDFPVEQFWRDNRLNAIHEGTHGIQALDLLDRKVLGRHGKAALSVLRDAVSLTCDRACGAGDPELEEHGIALFAFFTRLERATALLSSEVSPERRIANATTYLEAFGHTVVAWLWLDQILALRGAEADDFVRGKRAACRFFFRCELPRIGPQLDLIKRLDTTAVDTDPAWL